MMSCAERNKIPRRVKSASNISFLISTNLISGYHAPCPGSRCIAHRSCLSQPTLSKNSSPMQQVSFRAVSDQRKSKRSRIRASARRGRRSSNPLALRRNFGDSRNLEKPPSKNTNKKTVSNKIVKHHLCRQSPKPTYQVLDFVGLAHHVVHAAVHHFVLLRASYVGRHAEYGDPWEVVLFFELSNGAGGAVAVHHRHLEMISRCVRR